MLDHRTVDRIRDLDLAPGPLFVCDVDEVVLTFLDPFRGFLGSRELMLVADSFRLHGNVRRMNGRPVPGPRVSELIDEFFGEQDNWQTLVPGAREGLDRIAEKSAVILLTAMRHGHFELRERHLRALGIVHPLVTTEGSKGLALGELSAHRPIVFVDDLPSNHAQVQAEVDDVMAIHFMADRYFAPLLPTLPEGVRRAEDWREIVSIALGAVDADRPAIAGSPALR